MEEVDKIRQRALTEREMKLVEIAIKESKRKIIEYLNNFEINLKEVYSDDYFEDEYKVIHEIRKGIERLVI